MARHSFNRVAFYVNWGRGGDKCEAAGTWYCLYISVQMPSLASNCSPVYFHPIYYYLLSTEFLSSSAARQNARGGVSQTN